MFATSRGSPTRLLFRKYLSESPTLRREQPAPREEKTGCKLEESLGSYLLQELQMVGAPDFFPRSRLRFCLWPQKTSCLPSLLRMPRFQFRTLNVVERHGLRKRGKVMRPHLRYRLKSRRQFDQLRLAERRPKKTDTHRYPERHTCGYLDDRISFRCR